MMKPTKPTKEEFIKDYESIEGKRSLKIGTLSVKYGVCRSTIYNWERTYIENKFPSKEILEKKSFWDWVGDYREPLDKQPDYQQFFDMGDEDSLIICMSDTHMGSKECDHERLGADIEEMLKYKNVYVVLVGDIIDIGPASPGGLSHEQRLSYKSQVRMASALIDVIGPKMIALTQGCHSHQTYRATGYFIEEELAKKTLSGVYLGDGGLLDVKLGDNLYSIFMSHKLRGGSKKAPASSLLAINETELDFDIGIVAHKHTPSTMAIPRRGKEIHLVNCGSYKNLDLFGRKNGYTPSLKRTPAIWISSKKKKIQTYMDFHDGLERMELA